MNFSFHFTLSRSRQDRLTAWSPVFMLAALAALTYWLHIQVQAPGASDASRRHDPDYFLDNFIGTRLGEDGKPRQMLSAVKLVHYPDDSTTHLDGPNFVMIEQNKPPLRVTAQRGVVTANGADAHFYGDVHATRDALPDGSGQGPLTLTTEYLHVVPDRNWAETDKAVTITQPHAIIHAIGMQFDNKTHTAKLLADVRGEFTRQK
jgi:lipopolysaccharide export system protein LptC